MTHPSPPDPWGPRAPGQPEPGRREHGRPPYGRPATPTQRHPGTDHAGYGDHELGTTDHGVQGPAPAGNGPHASQGSPPPGFGARRGRHSQPGPPDDGYPYSPQDSYTPGSGPHASYDPPEPYGRLPAYGPSYGDQTAHREQDAYGDRSACAEQAAYADRNVYGDRDVYGEQDPYNGLHASYGGRQDDHGPLSPPYLHGGGNGHYDPYTHQRHQAGYDHLTPATLDPPRKRGKTMVIALSAALGVLLLGGGTVGAVSYVKSSNGTPAALPSGGGTSPPTTAPWPSDEPAEADAGGGLPPSAGASPKGEPSAAGEPSGRPSAEEVPSGEPTGPATRPSPSSSAAQPGSPIAHTEFDDWKFTVSGVTFDANKVGGWTYDTCEPVDAQGLLEKNDCRRAVQLAYSAYRGHLKAVQVMLEFPSVKAATTAATQMAESKTDTVNIRRDMALPTFEYGKVRTNPAKKYVVVTIVTADKTAKAKADDFHLYMQADSVSYFLLRDVTITS
ncbi:hypothetical protein WBK31_09755 [Nonomuraea sp. N2-4H]|uniref:hypothetical protein n=1 Tax=Nonomuraea sp. N2-4H TaxID=3128898 RepID=UPI00324480F2